MPEAALQTDMHWAAALVGCRYRALARGPRAFDCWGVVQYGWWHRRQIELPDVRQQAERAFAEVDRHGRYSAGGISAHEIDPRDAAELDVVYMTTRDNPHHVGLWGDVRPLGGILHALEGVGVVFQRGVDLGAHGISIVKVMRLEVA
jgi:cell wall-associated NlpC family hydrolase